MELKKLRGQLDELGYFQNVSQDSVPLVEKLVLDLRTTTASLQKFMQIAQNAIEERDNLQSGAEPYKCDNARLVKECNSLHLNFLQYREQHDLIKKDLERRIESLKAENLHCTTEKAKFKKRIQELESEIVETKIISTNPKYKPKRTSSTTLPDKFGKGARNLELNSAMALADQKAANLSKDIKKLKEQNIEIIQANEILSSQVQAREKEIQRLSTLLEGGRPLQAINRDCMCTKDLNDCCNMLQEQINKITNEKRSLESRMKECLAKQHEAMKRAMHLAERNKLLEKEMRDIDHLALAVESECNNTVKDKNEKLNRLQGRMQSTILQLQNLEQENAKLNSDLNAIKAEKQHLQTVLETSLDEKKRLSDKMNNFTRIEQDLNAEIDRLARLSAEQRRKIAELEASTTHRPYQDESEDEEPRHYSNKRRSPLNSPDRKSVKSKGKSKKAPAKKPTKGGPTKKSSSKSPEPNSPIRNSNKASARNTDQCTNDTCRCSSHLKQLLDKELEYKEQQSARCVESLRAEKDYYMKEYHKMLEQMKSRPGSSSNGKNSDIVHKLLEKEQSLASLQHQNRILSQEKFDLMNRLETSREPSDSERNCLKSTCKRTERERDLLRGDLERLEHDKETLQMKIKNLNSDHISERDRLKKCLQDTEDQLRKLEQEHRDLRQNQGSRRSTINTLEEDCQTLREQLRLAQTELMQQKLLYSQLKTLHEQTDQSLVEAQAKLVHAQTDLAAALENVRRRDKDRGTTNKEVDLLKGDINIMRGQMAQIDKDKDDLLVALDDKTEKLAMLEIDIKAKDKKVASLESMVNELNKKINMTIDETSSQEHLIRNSQTEIGNLRQELETAKRIKDSAVQENRRLQDDLAAVTSDCRDCRKELEIYRRQVDDLKTQLQHYVAEVKRTEDMISNKELERNELLDQFRSLSHEANVLENNNHSLETEATQSRVQLSVALDHANDLEQKFANQQSIVQSYEKQISELTSQIASLEIQLRQCMVQYEHNDLELGNMRELCHKLENENSKIKRQLRDRDDQHQQLDQNVEHLRSERELLQNTASNDRRNAESMERILDDAKHDSTELRLLNQDLQEEVQRMKVQLQELKDKLINTSEQVDMYQEKALDYSLQNKQLRREIANERFHRSTRDSESSKYPSL